MLVISWPFCQFMPKNEEEVRAALTAQAVSNEEANALCSLASLSIQGNADQKRQRLLGFLSGPVSRRRIGWLDLLLRCHELAAATYRCLNNALYHGKQTCVAELAGAIPSSGGAHDRYLSVKRCILVVE
eukprot:COSAG03_NODE_190_length_10901_cov_14.018330_8_plen_129_part_00